MEARPRHRAIGAGLAASAVLALLAGATPVAAQDDADPRGPARERRRIDRRSRPDTGRLVLRHEADHARHPRRLRHQRLVAGVVRRRALRGREVPERQADRRWSAAARPGEVDLGRQRAGRPGRQRARDHPRLRRQAQLASIQAATAAGVKVVPWGADPGGTPGKDYVSYVDWSSPVARHHVGELDGRSCSTARATSSSSAARPATRSPRGS